MYKVLGMPTTGLLLIILFACLACAQSPQTHADDNMTIVPFGISAQYLDDLDEETQLLRYYPPPPAE